MLYGACPAVQVTHKRSGIEMTRKLIQCLLPGAWLNDEVMNMYMGLLQVVPMFKWCTQDV